MKPEAFVKNRHLVVIIPSYNNIRWYQRNLDSLRMQEYGDWHAIYINDCSTDGTGAAVAAYIKDHHMEHTITLINNTERRGALANLYDAIHSCDDRHVIVTLDGDDWLYNNQALAHVNQMYADPDVWMTYGMYQEYPGGGICAWREIPAQVIANNAFRQAEWYSSHLRTFYAWLFKKIKKEDLLYQGAFYAKTWDLAFMFPMLEMAGTHSRKSDKVLYVYNHDNPINDWKEDLPYMMMLDKHIRQQSKYEPISSRSS
jgi:glycosyltransferase involved in cell wall biosynthesis